MKLICNKEKLTEIINTVQKAVAPKAVMPILECIKIDASADGNVVLRGISIYQPLKGTF